MQNREELARPHKGRVVGAGVGHKHSHYYPESKEGREERKKKENEDVSKRLDVVDAKVDSIPSIVQKAVQEQVKSIVLVQQQALIAWDRDGRKGPMPLFSIADSTSVNEARPNAPATEAPAAGARATEAPAADARATEAPAQPEQSPALSVPRSSPSVSGMPVLIAPTPLDELNALTVTCPRFAQHTGFTSSLCIVLGQTCFRRPAR